MKIWLPKQKNSNKNCITCRECKDNYTKQLGSKLLLRIRLHKQQKNAASFRTVHTMVTKAYLQIQYLVLYFSKNNESKWTATKNKYNNR